MLAGAKLSFAVIAGLLTLQADRLILSHFVTLHELGIFSVALALAYGVLQLSYPLLTSVTPSLALAFSDQRRFEQLCGRLLRAVTYALLAATLLYALFGEQLVRVWLRNSATFLQVRPILRLLLLGTALNIVYQVSYQRWLIMGRTRSILLVNTLSLALAICLTPILVIAWGIFGAATSWIAINAIGVGLNLRWMLVND